MTFSVTRAQALRLAANVGAEPPPAKPTRPRRVTPDEKLCIAGWMPRYRAGVGWDYWQAATTQASAGVGTSYHAARRLALARLRDAGEIAALSAQNNIIVNNVALTDPLALFSASGRMIGP